MTKAQASSAVGIFLVAVYVTVGLAASALLSISKLAAISAVLGVGFALARVRIVPRAYVAYGALFALICASSLWADSPDWEALGTYLTAACGGLLVALAISCGWLGKNRLLLLLCIPLVVNAAAFLAGVNYTSVLYDIDVEAAGRRFSGLVGHPNTMVMRLTLPIVLLTLFSMLGDKLTIPGKKSWLVAFACFGSAAFAATASGSKKALLVLAICALFYSLHLLANPVSHGRKLIAILVAATAALWVAIGTISFDEIESVARLQSMLGGSDESTGERAYLVDIGWRLFLQEPIFGYGLGSFATLSGMGFYSHNNLIELLVSGGLLLAVAYYGFIFFLLWRTYVRFEMILPAAFVASMLLSYDVTGITASDRAAQIFIGVVMAATFMRSHRNMPR